MRLLLLLLCACAGAEPPKASRAPAAGAVPRERALEVSEPVMTMTLLEKGRHGYDIICAACHGLTGEGGTPAARLFAPHQPVSLHEPRVREETDELLYAC